MMEIPNFTDGSTLWLGFSDPEVERAYCAELSCEVLKRSQIFVRFTNMAYVVVLVRYIFSLVQLTATTERQSLDLLRALTIFFYTVIVVGLNLWSRLKPSRRSEFGIVGLYPCFF